MIDKQKQIEKMAKELSPYGFCKITICENCNRKKLSKCRYYSFAKQCIMNGYRKQNDTAREILDEVSQHFGGAWLVELYKKYGVEVEE